MRKHPRNELLAEYTPENRPSVLLVGNGIVQAFDSTAKTNTLIKNAWRKSHNSLLAKDHPIWELPFPMQIVVASKDRVQDYMTQLASDFKAAKITRSQETLIQKILDVKFDAILSSNYSLEFEKATFPAYSEGKVKRNYIITTEQTNSQEQLGIFQCTELPYDDDYHPTLWHIHGTALRRKSLVMGHYYYGKLLTQVTQRAEKVGRVYKAAQTTASVFRPFSWIDFFLIGDVYIVGFGLNPSETDIWWLLSYKKQFEKTNVYFYEPHIPDDKKLLLDCYNVITPAIPINTKNGKDDYIEYYYKVFEYIKNENPMGL